ncbi:DUF6265 family protein [Roseivirga sp. E12]|uniref:DUF6265 family protein n=1 Tax=Roseivirga sp. E12 TaxID=2819237 RepID=UPI001ABC8B5C|nr:DUF6265 family protein [Roseivirga sp. E12]MBO3697439.1 hypothetical protein [Roseivirga sp. E12]
MKYFLTSMLLGIFFNAYSQKTLQLGNSLSPKASLSEVAWITGSWEGEAFGGQVQEVWTPPLGDSMMCAFKLVVDGKVQFYELCQIREENGSLVLRLKHFNGDLKGWEEKNDTVDFKLVKVEKDIVYFEGFTIEKVSQDKINMYVMIGEEGKKSEVAFNYSRSIED